MEKHDYQPLLAGHTVKESFYYRIFFQLNTGTGRHEEVSIHASQETWTKSCQDVLNNTVQVAQESKSSEIINTPQPTLQLGGVDPARKKEVAVQILEKLARGRTVEDCLDLLVQMDIQNAIEESE